MSDALRLLLKENPRKSYTFRNEPVPVADPDLKRIYDDLQREAARWPEVQTVAVDRTTTLAGTIQVRLIACYDPNLIDDASHDFSDVVKIIGTRNILEDSCLCLDEETYLSLNKIDPLLQPEHVFGRRLEVRAAKQDEIRFYYISRLLDLLATGYLEPLYQWELDREVDTRKALEGLDRFARLLDMVKIIMRRQGAWEHDPHAAKIRWIKDHWFDLGLPRYEYLMEAVRESFLLLHDLIGELDAYFQKARIVNMKMESSAQLQAFLATDRNTTAYIKTWSDVEAVRMTREIMGKQDPFIPVLPASFAIQLCEYMRGTEIFHRYIKSCFRSEGLSGNLERSYICWERGKLLNRCQEIAARLNGGKPGKDLVFGCNLKPGAMIARAANAFNLHRNKSNLKRLFGMFRGEESNLNPEGSGSERRLAGG